MGLAGGDIDAAVTAADNAARYNSMQIVVDAIEHNTLLAQREAAQTPEEQESIDQLLETTTFSVRARGLQAAIDLAGQDLPECVQAVVDYVNAPIERAQAALTRGAQVCEEAGASSSQPFGGIGLFPSGGTGFVPSLLEIGKLPTTYGGALLMGAPLAKPLKGAAASVVKKALPLSKMEHSLRKAAVPLSLQSSSSSSSSMGTRSSVQTEHQLLPGEGDVGTYRTLLDKHDVRGDNISAHHMPNKKYMEGKGIGIDDGVSMMVQDPVPGSGGRHRAIHKELQKQDPSLTPRDALAQSVQRARTVYKGDGLYAEARPSLIEVVKQNKEKMPHLFNKGD